MALIRWEPVAELNTIQNEMNRLFNSFFDPSAPTGRGNGARFQRQRHVPARGAPGEQPVVLEHVTDALPGDRTVIMTAHPGRIKQIVNVPFPHPRDLLQLSASSEFGKLKLDIWRVLEEEVNRARSEMEK